MPQLEKGGKYVFGWSRICPDGSMCLPGEALQEYHIEPGHTVILISGSRTTGGFCVANRALIQQSTLADILQSRPELANEAIEEGSTIQFKGRRYGWTTVQAGGVLVLRPQTLDTFALHPGDDLLAIRGSNLAFVLGFKGPIIDLARRHPEIPVFE